MKKALLFTLLVLSTCGIIAQNQVPEINNFSYTLEQGQIIFSYDLFDAEGDTCEVFLRASADGVNYTVKPLVAIGDIGSGIVSGMGKEITWNHTIEFLPGTREDFSFQLIADDGSKPDLSEIISAIDTNEILKHFFKVYGNNHPSSPDQYESTRSNIQQHYLMNGYQMETDSFTFIGEPFPATRQGLNIYGTKTGLVNADSTVLMTGHYDTVEDTPGADDNAMSVAVTMEAARVLKDHQFRNNIRFANWDLEEEGLVGAYYYSNSQRVLGTKSVINFDGMTIYKTEPNSQSVPTGFDILFPDAYAKAEADEFRGNFITIIADALSGGFNNDAVAAFEKYTPGFRYVDITCPTPGCLVATDLRRSDHAPFWDKAIPSVFMTSSTEFRTDCYHQPCDTTYNVWFSGEVLKAATGLLIEQAGLLHAGTAIAEPVTSVEKLSIRSEASLFPNPIIGSAFLQIDAPHSGKLKVFVYDRNGKEVLSLEKLVGAGPQTIVWQPESLKNGSYIVKVNLNGTQILSQQTLIQLDESKYHHSH